MDVDGVKDIVFRRVPGVDYSLIRNDIKMFNIFLSIDGIRSVSDISREDAYDVDYLFPVMDKMEKMGLLVPVGGADSPEPEVHSSEVFCNLPKEFMTGIEAVDNQHQRLVDMVTQLDDVRKTSFQTNELRQEAVGRIVIEMIDYTISHFAFEESLMEDANTNSLLPISESTNYLSCEPENIRIVSPPVKTSLMNCTKCFTDGCSTIFAMMIEPSRLR
jgi:hypothetical protein